MSYFTPQTNLISNLLMVKMSHLQMLLYFLAVDAVDGAYPHVYFSIS